jgi:ATPase subunit of ABC transporter with duplicated ATPase domains
MDKIERPIEKKAFEIGLSAKTESGTLGLTVSDVVTGYESGFSIGPVSFQINYGERLGIIGPNGAGKSTLLKTITGELKPKSGQVEIGSGVVIGNMMQEHQTLPRDKTPYDYLESHTELDQTQIYTRLVQFGLGEEAIRQPISKLSPGGRARLTLCLFSALSVNLLVLDEPTNHLDIEALDALELTVSSYQGSILLVSHDRYFLEQTKLDYSYIMDDGKLKEIVLSDYLEQAEQRANRLLKLL